VHPITLYLKIVLGKILFKITGEKKIRTIKDIEFLDGETITRIMYAFILYVIIRFMFAELIGFYYWLFPAPVINEKYKYLVYAFL